MSAAPRPGPVAPHGDEWSAAVADYSIGRVVPFRLGLGDDAVEVAATASWVRQWRDVPLTARQRAAVRAACTQIAKDRVHPCLGKRVAPVEPVGETWMASPTSGVTVTWRAHWSTPDVPVLMTLLHDPSAVRPGYPAG